MGRLGGDKMAGQYRTKSLSYLSKRGLATLGVLIVDRLREESISLIQPIEQHSIEYLLRFVQLS